MGAELHFAVIDAGLSELATAVAPSGISTATFSPRAYAEILVRENTAIERIHWAGTETICEWDGPSGRRP